LILDNYNILFGIAIFLIVLLLKKEKYKGFYLNCYNGFKRFNFGNVRNKKKEEKTGFN